MEDEHRNLVLCQLVAEAINQSEGTDFRAAKSEPGPADALLVSESGKHGTRGAQVVSTPGDFTIRYDSGNIKKFERNLRLALKHLGVSQCGVTVNWSESARRYSSKGRHIERLAEVIASEIPINGYRCLRGVDLYDYSQELSEIVNYVSMFRLESMGLAVHSSMTWWAPHDGQWIEEALAKKVGKYGDRIEREMILVIDGLAHLDIEQISAFRASYDLERISYAEVWTVTMGKPYRLKPAS